MEYIIREMTDEDYKGVAEIYGQGIESGTATFCTTVPDYEEWNKSHYPFCRYVAAGEGRILGWTALTVGITREAYKTAAELSIYVREGYRRHGIGFALIEKSKSEAGRFGIRMLESRICGGNTGSIKLHEKCGFRYVGFREKIAADKFGVWQNVVEMEILLSNLNNNTAFTKAFG